MFFPSRYVSCVTYNLNRYVASQRLVLVVPRFSYQTQRLAPMAAGTSNQASCLHTLTGQASDKLSPRTELEAVNGVVTDRSPAPLVSPEDAAINLKYRPFLLDEKIMKSDWISQLELKRVMDMAQDDLKKTGKRLRILVLYGSLRERYSEILLHACPQANFPGVEGHMRGC